jgi:hypothetical protein
MLLAVRVIYFLEGNMKSRNLIGLSAATAFGLTLISSSAIAQQKSLKDQLVGTWMLSSWEQTYPDGRKDQAFGSAPKGIHSFSPDGRFALIFLRPDIPKVASNDRVRPTTKEAMAIAKGAIAYYGTYSVNEADKTIALNLEGTSYSNQIGLPQKRIITLISASELKYENPRSTSGGQIRVGLKRAE